MSYDPYAERKKLTFAQAEGHEPLPTQLERGVITAQMRSLLWSVVFQSLQESKFLNKFRGRPVIGEPWRTALQRKHILHDNLFIDDFSSDYGDNVAKLRKLFEFGSYWQVLDALQFFLRERIPTLAGSVRLALQQSHAAYTVLDDDETFIPISSPEEARTVSKAIADLAAVGFDGGFTHLRLAAEHLTKGAPADSIRESIHAVEAVVRKMTGKDTLAGALQVLNSRRTIHKAMQAGFGSLYGFTSDEKGIRHALIDDASANVDAYDAQFMLGACAAFCSYLANRARE